MSCVYDEDALLLLESSLRNYILSEKEKRPHVHDASLIKYRGLKLGINDENPAEITFTVRIAGFEAQFRTYDGQKVMGSICGDEREVYRWYNLGDIKTKMVNIIANGTRSKEKEQLKKRSENSVAIQEKKSIWQQASES